MTDTTTCLRESAPDNPHAFPQASVFAVPGMTLRDWFAGQIMAGLVASPIGKFPEHHGKEALARDAYLIADAMLARRSPSQIEEGKDNG